MIKNKILNDIVKFTGRCEITIDMIMKTDAIEFDENLRIDLWLNEELKNTPKDERHSSVKDNVYNRAKSLNYGIYKIIKSCC